jgi:hypothetical protein
MKALAPLLAALLLVACGGGGGGGDNPAVATGQFTGGPVKGLQYRTASQSGETGASGEFRYLPGEAVTFFVGDITVGAAAGAAKVSPFDLAGVAPPATVPNSSEASVAFDQAINLAIFLQTLDADGDPANGIEIPAQIRALASGSTLDFKLARDKFSRSLPLRKLVGAGRTAGLWGGVNAIRTPTRAIKALYASLGMTPVVDTVGKVETFDLKSGTLLERATATFDANGNRTQIASEYDNHGVLERSIMNFRFDANGNETYSESDSNGDGIFESWTNTTLNVNGDLMLAVREYDFDGDGMVDGRLVATATYNADTYMIGIRTEFDANNDGVVDSVMTEARSYDAKGNLILSEVDSNGDGVVDSRTTSHFDADGRMTSSEDDSNGDGVLDSRATFSYDTGGREILLESDSNGDGVIDKRAIYKYDTQGNPISWERDDNADGVIDRRTVRTYDSDGYLILLAVDMDADGFFDQQTIFTHTKVAG